MKYLRKFETEAEYNAYPIVVPFVGLINDSKKVVYVPRMLPLHFIALEDTTISFSLNTVQYSFDNKEWSTLSPGTKTRTIEAGEVIYFKASGLAPVAVNGIGTFTITGKCDVAGSVLSMLYGDNFEESANITLPNYAFRKLFASSSNLRDASRLILPSINLSYQCYNVMFYQSGITAAPKLPAGTMASECYKSMFQDCANLQDAPALPAMTLADSCYRAMFAGTGIKSVVLPATKLVTNCYNEMFQRCSAISYVKMMAIDWNPTMHSNQWMTSVTVTNGTFVKNSAATWTETFDANAIPDGWTVETADK